MTQRIFFTGDEGEECFAEEWGELHVLECENPATYTVDDTPICAEHKDELKKLGLAE